ncbi:MAG: alpha-D-ribose 1-methylphosphonate 5-triphosphate diphosphatase [Pseudomonadota bacterium]
MPQETILANATLVLPQETLRGSLVLRDGVIAGVDQGALVPSGAIDCEGDCVAPGLVEVHTDNLERHMRPRPKVDWPHAAAILAHDAELASVGITTVFDALRVGSIPSPIARGGYRRYARPLASEILELRAAGALKISHHLHLRAEICSETLLDELAEFGPEDRVRLVSLMDHTPGQRQFVDISKFEEYLRGKYGISKSDFEEYALFLAGLQAERGAAHEAGAVAAAGRLGAVLASHDDTTPEQVEVSARHGVTIAEFPTREEAAVACHNHGIAVIMGAPNLMRGGSHSGNVAASALAEAGLLDVLSSDYVPGALLHAALRLGALWGSLARGIATVTQTPAHAMGLSDRGALAQGLRADVIRIHTRGDLPVLRGVWAAGEKVG